MTRLLILAPLLLAACAHLAPITDQALATIRAACALSPEARAAAIAPLGVTKRQAAAICEAAK